MDFGRAFTYVFEDEEWIAIILIGALAMIVPFMSIGLMLVVARNVVRGNPKPLPRWSEFMEILRTGFWGFVVMLVYALPIVLVAFVMLCPIIAIAAVSGSEEAAGGFVALATICMVPVLIVAGIFVQWLIFPALGRFIQTNDFGYAIRVREVWAETRRNAGLWGMVLLMYFVCNFVAGLGSMLLFVGLFLTLAYAQAVFGHILGQAILLSNGSQAPSYGSSYDPPRSM